MAQPSAYLILSSQKRTGEDGDDLLKTVRLLTQSREDLSLAEHVERALRATGHQPLREIKVTVHARIVILKGRVPNYYLKQVAQATAMTGPGVHQVCNNLEVGPPS